MIHPTAIVEPGAQLGENVEIGAYAYVGGDVSLGAGTVIHHHAVVEGFTVMGENNEVFPFAVIGGKTQDLKYDGGKPGLKIGDRNTFREYVTVHGGTKDGEFTTLGAHDCRIGNFLVMSSQSAFAGHVVCGDHVNFGWGTGIHQFARIGDYAMLAAMSRITQDVPPYMIVEGTTDVSAKTVNVVALQRNGFPAEDIKALRLAHRIIYHENLNRTQALEKILADPELAANPHIRKLVDFYRTSKRGVH